MAQSLSALTKNLDRGHFERQSNNPRGREISLNGTEGPVVAISPDSSRLAYMAENAGQVTHLSVRSLEGR